MKEALATLFVSVLKLLAGELRDMTMESISHGYLEIFSYFFSFLSESWVLFVSYGLYILKIRYQILQNKLPGVMFLISHDLT